MSEREYMLTDREILERLPQLIDFSTLTPEQLRVLQMHKQKMDLLTWLLGQEYDQKVILRRQKQTNAPSSDIQQTEMRLVPLRKNVENAQDDIMLFENQHISILQPLIFAGRKAILGDSSTTAKQTPEQFSRQKSSENLPYPLTIQKPQYTYTSAQTKQSVTPPPLRHSKKQINSRLLYLFCSF